MCFNGWDYVHETYANFFQMVDVVKANKVLMPGNWNVNQSSIVTLIIVASQIAFYIK